MLLTKDSTSIPMSKDNSEPADTGLLYAPHSEPGRFFNPWAPPFNNRFVDLLRWQLGRNKKYDKSAPPQVPVVANDGAYLKDRGAPDSVTWVGHSAFAVQDGGEVFLTDPHFGKRALLPARVTPPGIPLAAVPPDAFAVLSHNHYDHLDDWSVRHLPATIPWFVPLGLAGFFRDRGRQVVELDWWQSARHGRWTLTCLPAQHWSNRFGAPRNSSLWCGWLLDSISSATPATSTASRRSGGASPRSTSPSSPSAPTSHAGSCAPSTSTPRRPTAPSRISAPAR
jgi:N-acyl-phosphatidylethanolamine-hydrolysing phospholipase D